MTSIDPATLFTRDRLDLVVKWRFFKQLMDGKDSDAERVYSWHIEKRTGGREPGSWKTSVNDYVIACTRLLASMTLDGFDPQQPAQIGSDLRLRTGAHRIACAKALEIHAIVKYSVKPGGSRPWDMEWFRRHGLPPADQDRIYKDWEVCSTYMISA